MTLQEATLMLGPTVDANHSRNLGSVPLRPSSGTLDQRLRKLRRQRAFTRLSSLATLAGWLLGAGALVTMAAGGLVIGH